MKLLLKLLRFVCYALSINQPLWAFYRAWNICHLCIEIQWRIQLDGNIDSLWQGKMKHSLIVFSAQSLQTSNTIQYTISGPNFYDIDHNKKYKSNKQDHVLGVPVPACSAQCPWQALPAGRSQLFHNWSSLICYKYVHLILPRFEWFCVTSSAFHITLWQWKEYPPLLSDEMD